MSFPHFLAQIADPKISKLSNNILKQVYDEAVDKLVNPDRYEEGEIKITRQRRREIFRQPKPIVKDADREEGEI